MGLLDGMLGNAAKIDPAKIQQEFAQILPPGGSSLPVVATSGWFGTGKSLSFVRRLVPDANRREIV